LIDDPIDPTLPVGVTLAEFDAYQAQVAAEFDGLSGTYALLDFLALDTDGRYFPAAPAGMYLDTDGRYYASPGYPAVAKMTVDTDGRYYPVSIGA
jgi:hypothetical protein